MSDYRRNHYVPEWFQHRFIPSWASEPKFYYLDLKPETRVSKGGNRYTRNNLLRRGPRSAFRVDDLYATRVGALRNTEIEQHFFGPIDREGKEAVEYFHDFRHPSANSDLLHAMLSFMSVQKLRTPKGLAHLARTTKTSDPNHVLFRLQEFRDMYCATWTECIWSVVDASKSSTKFLVSDHPVTVYNRDCFPGSSYCRDSNDPDVRLNGTHTIFPLGLERALLLTNLSWVRNPYGNPTRHRPNPGLFRGAMFGFNDVQTGRTLTDDEVTRINHIIKSRARRYVAGYEKDWLFPERLAGLPRWDRLTDDHLLMPDPRAVPFASQFIMGSSDHPPVVTDEYGRHPADPAYHDERSRDRERDSFRAFQGEYARLHGPARRGNSMSPGGDSHIDDSEYHRHLLSLERFKPKRRNAARRRR